MATRFGTTPEMIIQSIEENDTTFLLAIDSTGLYMTTHNYVGKHLADRNRYSNAARQDVAARLDALGLNAEELWKSNQHLIQSETASTKKVNPLKASKRGSKG